ncbi:MAG: hypothetical protein KZQ58_05045 [gamma proteobacterium symbiont of Bathyaustriella thionipta]|nr:hypothetical protein [gamma proteobacterium symbiont of Bathyaustriella thionipta]
MDSILIRRHYARNTLFRMIILSVATAGLLLWKWDFIADVYFKHNLTAAGPILNGSILVLFTLGLLRIIVLLLHYVREERALVQFARNQKDAPQDPLRKVAQKSIIAHRYHTMKRLGDANAPVNHNALASTLVAAESTRNGFPRFINNILILTGVFGTIVSLSIALIGASNMLENSVDISGMSAVIHGMSTALSTTITAIVCYVYFSYFNHKLYDVQTNLISAVEQITTNYLLPRFQVQADSVLYEFTGLVRGLQNLVKQMDDSQNTFQHVEKRLINTLDVYRNKVESLSGDMSEIKQLLKLGFRLPPEK